MNRSKSSEQEVVRREVTSMLSRSSAFRQLPADRQHRVLEDTARVVGVMASKRGSRSGDPYAVGLEDESEPDRHFVAEGTREGVDAAASLIQKIDFPQFVAQLVKGTFHAIVQSSIEQMEAYADLVRNVATSVNEFRDQNVTTNQGRDHLVSRYPNLLQINMNAGQPSVGLRPGAEFAELPDFQRDLGLDSPVTDLDEETLESTLVPAARDQVAESRHKLLATMVLMGINRIVVTDGRINAKVRFTFQASDTFSRTATSYDYDNFGEQTVVHDDRGYQIEGTEKTYDKDGALQKVSGGNRYTTGAYARTTQPIVQLVGQEDTQSDAALAAAGQLTGEVSINFKSETFPLERMASTDQILTLQQAQGSSPGVPPQSPGAGSAPSTS